jgi:HEAT repeat protein
VRLLGGRQPKVEKLRRKNDVDGLVGALSYEDLVRGRDGDVVDLGVDVRRLAAEALAGMQGHAAFNGLLRALDDPEEGVRRTAVHALRERGDPVAVEQLTSAVTSWTQPEYARARAEAADALGFLRDPTAPRRFAAGLVTRPAEPDEETDAPIFRQLAQGAGRDAVAGTIDDLVARLPDASVSARVRRLLVWLAPDSVDPLIRVLDDSSKRREAIFALGDTHDSRAVEKLCEILLGEHDSNVRTAAAWALGEIRDPSAVESLLLAAADEDYAVRSAASESFDKLGNSAIAVAMSALIRPALENGARPAVTDAIEAPEEETVEATAVPDEPPVAAQPAPPPGTAPGVVAPPPVTQVGPLLRRLLDWRALP